VQACIVHYLGDNQEITRRIPDCKEFDAVVDRWRAIIDKRAF
jgi:hypothetical protein